jgi:phosphate-selective porin OprO/OprP
LTYAPIHTEHDLSTVRASGRYHQPNDSTAANNDRVLRWATASDEANILGRASLARIFPAERRRTIPQNLFNSSAFAGKCTERQILRR